MSFTPGVFFIYFHLVVVPFLYCCVVVVPNISITLRKTKTSRKGEIFLRCPLVNKGIGHCGYQIDYTLYLNYCISALEVGGGKFSSGSLFVTDSMHVDAVRNRRLLLPLLCHLANILRRPGDGHRTVKKHEECSYYFVFLLEKKSRKHTIQNCILQNFTILKLKFLDTFANAG